MPHCCIASELAVSASVGVASAAGETRHAEYEILTLPVWRRGE
jgi:hypothetical protein